MTKRKLKDFEKDFADIIGTESDSLFERIFRLKTPLRELSKDLILDGYIIDLIKSEKLKKGGDFNIFSIYFDKSDDNTETELKSILKRLKDFAKKIDGSCKLISDSPKDYYNKRYYDVEFDIDSDLRYLWLMNNEMQKIEDEFQYQIDKHEEDMYYTRYALDDGYYESGDNDDDR